MTRRSIRAGVVAVVVGASAFAAAAVAAHQGRDHDDGRDKISGYRTSDFERNDKGEIAVVCADGAAGATTTTTTAAPGEDLHDGCRPLTKKEMKDLEDPKRSKEVRGEAPADRRP